MTVGSFAPPIALAGFTVAGITAHTESVRDELHINHQGNHRYHSEESGNMLGNQVVQVRQKGWGLGNHWLTPAAATCAWGRAQTCATLAALWSSLRADRYRQMDLEFAEWPIWLRRVSMSIPFLRQVVAYVLRNLCSQNSSGSNPALAAIRLQVRSNFSLGWPPEVGKISLRFAVSLSVLKSWIKSGGRYTLRDSPVFGT